MILIAFPGPGAAEDSSSCRLLSIRHGTESGVSTNPKGFRVSFDICISSMIDDKP